MDKTILRSELSSRAARLACVVALLAMFTGNIAGAQTILPAPKLATPADGSTGQPTAVVFSWGGSVGALAYNLQISTNPGFGNLVVDSSGITSTSARVAGLAENTTYYWRVSGYTVTLSSPWSTVFKFTTLVSAPPAPQLASPANGATGLSQSFSVAWNASPGASSYEVQLDTLPGFSSPVIDAPGLTGTSLPVGPLRAGKSYYWRVRAQNAGGTSAWSAAWQFTTAPVIVPPPAPLLSMPANLATSQPQSVTLAWNASTGATLYHVQVSTSSSFTTLDLDDASVGGTSRVAGPLAAATTYYWRVSGIDAAGQGNWSAVWQFTTATAIVPPPAPLLSAPANGATSQPQTVMLGWNASTGATLYHVQVSTSSAFTTLDLDDATVAGMSRVAGPLAAATTYYWRVSGIDAAGQGSWSAIWSFSTSAPALPGTPALASPADGSTNQSLTPLLSWGSASAATAYQVQVSKASSFSTVVENDSGITATSRQTGTLESGVLYYWRVRGINGAGLGSWSSVWSFTTSAPALPGTPALASPADGSSNQSLTPLLSWNQASGATAYQVQVSTVISFASLEESDSAVTALSRQAGPLQSGVLYYWRVRGINAVGVGSWSSVRSFSTAAPGVPGVPGLVSPADGSTDQSLTPLLTWGAATGASTYQVQVAMVSTFLSTVESDSAISGTSRQIAALQSGGLYYWRVRGINGAGMGSWSNVWSFTTSRPAVPGVPALVSPADGSTDQPLTPLLTWDAPSGASAYHVQVSKVPTFATLVESDSAFTGTSRQTVALESNMHYYWRVRGLNAAGTGNWSSVWSFTTSTPSLPGVPGLVSPADASTNQPLTPILTWAVASGASKYHIQVSSVSTFTSLVESDSSIAGTSRQVGSLNSGAHYYWRVRGLSSVGAGGWSTVWSFTTSPPTAVVPALLSPQNGASNQQPPVVLSWSPVTGAAGYHLQLAADSLFSPVLIDDTTIQSVTYSAPIAAPDTNFWWRVSARTASGWGPFAHPWFFTTPIQNPQMVNLNVTIGFPARSNPADYTPADYRIVGLPGSGGAQASLLLSGSAGSDWQMYWDNGASANYLVKYASDTVFQFSTGRAFWLVRKGGWNVSTRVPAAPLNESQQAVIPLHHGWNLVTDPFTTSVTWSQVQSANGISGPLYSFSGGFTSAGTLDPYNGYYYFNTNDSATLRIPSAAATKPPQSHIVASAGQSAGSTDWRVNLELSTSGFTDSAAWFGTASEATAGLNVFDFRKPRTVAQMPEVYFDRAAWDSLYPIFASDIRPPIDSGEVWPIVVQSPPGSRITLTFRGLGAIPPDMVVRFIDDAGESTHDLRSDSVCVLVAPSPLTTYRVAVGKADYVRGVLSALPVPGSFVLEEAYPNPFNPTTLIPVQVPAPGAISLTVYDILGRRVREIFSGSVDRGRHLFTWNGSDEGGTYVASGVYLVRLSTAGGGFSAVRRVVLLR